MLVIVNEKYTYSCSFSVAVGDRVVLPSAHGLGTWTGVVTQIGSVYSGPLKEVLGFEDGREASVFSRYRSIYDPWEPQLDLL